MPPVSERGQDRPALSLTHPVLTNKVTNQETPSTPICTPEVTPAMSPAQQQHDVLPGSSTENRLFCEGLQTRLMPHPCKIRISWNPKCSPRRGPWSPGRQSHSLKLGDRTGAGGHLLPEVPGPEGQSRAGTQLPFRRVLPFPSTPVSPSTSPSLHSLTEPPCSALTDDREPG